MRSSLVSTLLLLAFAAANAGFVQLGHKNYYIENELRLNWFEAWNYCASNNMRLLSIETDMESRLLTEYLADNIFLFWTSGNDLATASSNVENREFVWSATGQPFTFTNWLDGEPNNAHGVEHCVVMQDLHDIGSRWNVYECEKTFRFICEF